MKKQSFSSRRVLISVLAMLLLLGTGLVAFSQARGDVNNDSQININDALLVARYTAGLPNTGTFILTAADTNCDGNVNINDALIIARKTAGLATICSDPSTVTPTPTRTPTNTPTNVTRPPHASNPFTGVSKWYVNQEWSANVRANGGASIANCNTVVWMDRINAIHPVNGDMGLEDHLDACLDQGADLFTLMIYDLPHRDCSASASNGELVCMAPDGGSDMQRYKTEFIDEIVRILDLPKYYGIHIIAFLETDSLPNLVTNVNNYAKCREVQERGCYVNGIQYALNKLYPLTHVYKYLEISHSAWLGWPDNFPKAIDLYKNTVRNTTNGTKSIDGFVDNTCNTLPNEEPYIRSLRSSGKLTDDNIKNSKFYDYNLYVDEFQFSDDWYNQMRGTFNPCGMMIDTARNGWGGPNRPKAAGTSTDPNTLIDQSRIDRRFHRGNWCNVKMAGIGERPKAAPRANTIAFVWLKPPGESDGVSQAGISDPDDPAKQFDKMCDPNGINTYCSCGTTDARSNMPHAGRFDAAYFQQLVANAYPPLN